MNAETAGWARRYRAALGRHLAHGTEEMKPRSAHRLGHQAVALGLVTLDVARIHGQALMSVALPGGSSRARERTAGRVKRFFSEAIVPIEKTHRAALAASARVNQLTRALRRRTGQSLVSDRKLERGIARRRVVEAALRKSGRQRIALLREAGRLQQRLRRLARTVLSSQEESRQKTSRRLHDEIAQALVSVGLRLLTVEKVAVASAGGFNKEIDRTQQLVRKSKRKVDALAHEWKRDEKTRVSRLGPAI